MMCVEEEGEEEAYDGDPEVQNLSPQLITPLDMEPNLSKNLLPTLILEDENNKKIILEDKVSNKD